jgi:hypothetical protein
MTRGSTQELYAPTYIDLHNFAYQLNQHILSIAPNVP